MVALRAETTGCGDVNSFGGAAVVTGFLVGNKKLSRPYYADGALRTGAIVDRLWAVTHLNCARWKPPGLRRGLTTNWAQL